VVADAGRVVAGSARGIRLAAPGAGTRPLADRVKQAVFGSLDPALPEATVLDLCAGSGGAAIEALSRGAARAILVERDVGTCRVIAENLRRAGVADRARVVRADALAYLRGLATADGPFDVVILDPPYAEVELRDACLRQLGTPDGPLGHDGLVVATGFAKVPPPMTAGLLRSTRERRFGETLVVFYRRAAPEDVPPPSGA
jgi:16S rRNA (guanine(966)-N(2))-methyltransferase RsmD